MNWDQIEAGWREYAGSARAHWAKLTDEDWESIIGKKQQLAGLIQERYGMTREEGEKQVEEWARGLMDVPASKSSDLGPTRR